jgi:hypothetical protein
VVLGSVAALAVGTGPAQAATATADFDNFADGTQVTTQYVDLGGTGQGVEFGQGPSGPAGVKPVVETVPAGQAASGSKVGNICNCVGEFNETRTFGRFGFAKRTVTVRAGVESGSTPVTLTAYGLTGNVLGSASATVTGGSGYKTPLTVSLPNREISFFKVAPAFECCGATPKVKIDDVSFDVPDQPPPGGIAAPPPAPDFGLVWLGNNAPTGAVLLRKGETGVSTTILVNRANGSTGGISFSVGAASLPDGLTAAFTPNPAGSSSVSLKLTAQAGADSVAGKPITVVATPGPGAGSAPRTLSIPITVVLGKYDLRVTGIEVTQGVQPLLNPGLAPTSALAQLPHRNYDNPTAPVDYKPPMLSLARDGKTVARVYSALAFPEGARVPGVQVTLTGYRNGNVLPGSPLLPDSGERELAFGEPWATFRDRANPTGAHTFTLPTSWASGSLTLKADLLPPPGDLFGPTYAECDTEVCKQNNTLTVRGIPFLPTTYLVITPLALTTQGGKYPVPPNQAFASAINLTPLGEGAFYFHSGPLDYTAELDVTVEAALPDSDLGGKLARLRVWDWASDHSRRDVVQGITTAGLRGRMSGNWQTTYPHGLSAYDPDQGGTNRPITSVGHELFHAYGMPHAGRDPDCYPAAEDRGIPWPPDDRGYIHGIGLDRRAGSGGAGTPYRIVAPRGLGVPAGLPGGPDQPASWFDLMSYCATDGDGDPDAWISDVYWALSLQRIFAFNLAKAAGASRARAAGVAGGSLAVAALTGPNGLEIGFVKRSDAPPTAPTPGTSFHLVARDGAGRAVADVPMTEQVVHADPGGSETALFGQIPLGTPALRAASGVARLEVSRQGQVLAQRTRGAHAPTVRILTPRRGARLGAGRTIAVRWRAADADGDPLNVKVESSDDAGRTWKTVSVGSNRGSARLRSAYFVPSRRARIRVRANDGFNETSAVAGPLTIVPRRPRVLILSPRRGQRVRADAALHLTGQAADAAGNRLLGRRLRWYDGRRPIGRGEHVSARGVRAGVRRIRLVARDRTGLAGTAAVTVRVQAVRPAFLLLRAPRRLTGRARRLTLRVASSVPAVLRAGGRRHRVGRRPRRVALRIRPGTRDLSLPLVLGSGRLRIRVVLHVPR